MSILQIAPEISVLIVSFNTRDMTIACVESVLQHDTALNKEVIVVDNASSDGSADAVAARFPKVRLLRMRTNIGFARANNLAAAQAMGDRLLLLNPDTVLLSDAITAASELLRTHRHAGIIGARTYFADGTLNYNSCHGRPTPWSLICMGLGLSSLFRRSRLFNPESLGRWKRDSVREIDAISGCFTLISRSLWQELGGFDESFFMYGEDTDLCLRAWESGYRCILCPEAKLIHHGGQSDKVRADKMVRLFRAKVQLIAKHWNRRAVWFGASLIAMWAFSRMVALGFLRVIQPRRTESYLAWCEIWRRRGEFRAISV